MAGSRFDLQLTSPCSKAWSELDGDERTRHCAECQLDVFNLSAATRAESEAHLAAYPQKTCLYFQRHADGRIATADDPLPRIKPNRRWHQRMAASLVALGVGLFPSCFQSNCEEPGDDACPAPPQPEGETIDEHDYPLLTELGGYIGELGTLEMPADEP